MADILADCNIDDALTRHMTNDIFKYWTSYRKGGIRFLVGQTLIPAAVSWVLETDEGDKLPNGEPGPGGEVVGWAQWHRMGTSFVARNWQKPGETWDNRIESTLQGIRDKYYSYVDPVDNRKNFSDLMSILRKPFDPEVFAEAWKLSGFCVRREYQRRGLGKILLRWGLEQAAAEKVPAVVKSSPAGIKSYELAGFRVFEKVDFGGSFDPGRKRYQCAGLGATGNGRTVVRQGEEKGRGGEGEESRRRRIACCDCVRMEGTPRRYNLPGAFREKASASMHTFLEALIAHKSRASSPLFCHYCAMSERTKTSFKVEGNLYDRLI
jgi:GNAT superfamily N-acetyltransferase